MSQHVYYDTIDDVPITTTRSMIEGLREHAILTAKLDSGRKTSVECFGPDVWNNVAAITWPSLGEVTIEDARVVTALILFATNVASSMHAPAVQQ